MVGEGVAPLGEVEVGGADGGALFVALGDEVVEVLVLRCSQGLQTEVINDEQRHADEGLKASLVRVDSARGIEAYQQLTLGGEQHVVIGTSGGLAERLCDVGLSGTARPTSHPLPHAAIVQHARRRRQQHGAALRAGVDDEARLAVRSRTELTVLQRGIGGKRHQHVATDDFDQLGGGAGAGMLVERLPSGDNERVGGNGLNPNLVAAGLSARPGTGSRTPKR